MNLLRRLTSLALLAGALAFAQTATTTATAAAPAPAQSMFLSLGESYDHYATPTPVWATTLDFGTKMASSNFYSISTLVMEGKTSTMRTGVGYLIKKSGPVAVIGLIDGGVTTTVAPTSVTLGNVGGGILARYDLGSISKKLQGFGVAAQVREVAAGAGTGSTPEFTLKLTYYLK